MNRTYFLMRQTRPEPNGFEYECAFVTPAVKNLYGLCEQVRKQYAQDGIVLPPMPFAGLVVRLDGTAQIVSTNHSNQKDAQEFFVRLIESKGFDK